MWMAPLENLCEWLPPLLYHFLHLGLRLLSYSFLAGYYLYYAATVLPLQIICSFLVERYVCSARNFEANLVTGALSVVAPACITIAGDDRRNRVVIQLIPKNVVQILPNKVIQLSNIAIWLQTNSYI